MLGEHSAIHSGSRVLTLWQFACAWLWAFGMLSLSLFRESIGGVGVVYGVVVLIFRFNMGVRLVVCV